MSAALDHEPSLDRTRELMMGLPGLLAAPLAFYAAQALALARQPPLSGSSNTNVPAIAYPSRPNPWINLA